MLRPAGSRRSPAIAQIFESHEQCEYNHDRDQAKSRDPCNRPRRRSQCVKHRGGDHDDAERRANALPGVHNGA